jgi:peptidoglycan/xylan/chitin deacetylase (PgdA/CDA1 family)
VTRGSISILDGGKRIAKLAISLCWYVVRGILRFALQLMGRSPRTRLVVLYYHGVPPAYRSNFSRQMESLQKRGRVWPAHHLGSLPSGKPNVAITFDDAYVSVAENALPELRVHKFPATIFVPAGSLGSPPRWSIEDGSLDADETVMSGEQIRALPSSLITLGSHTNTHPHLSQIDQDIAREEIEGSRRTLQTLTGSKILHLAFPYGDHDASTVELCKAAGYNYVFSVVPNAVDTENSGFVRGRVKADPFDWSLEFFLKCHGAYGWISEVSALKRKVRNWRRVREVRRPSYGHFS